jgi:hypothetical protein
LIKRRPFQGLRVTVKERLQGSFIDPAVPFPVEKAGFTSVATQNRPLVAT